MEKASHRSGANGPASDDNSKADSDSNRTDGPPTPGDGADRNMVKKKTGGKKTMWVDVQKCFNCGKHGHKLPKCTQCSQAFYCDSDCQRKHWK